MWLFGWSRKRGWQPMPTGYGHQPAPMASRPPIPHGLSSAAQSGRLLSPLDDAYIDAIAGRAGVEVLLQALNDGGFDVPPLVRKVALLRAEVVQLRAKVATLSAGL
jgi:hypothetical protein